MEWKTGPSAGHPNGVAPKNRSKSWANWPRPPALTVGARAAERPAPEAATLIGQGKVEELAAAVKSGEADVVIFDHDLSPTQQRNLEKALATKVIDRTQLILDIFASRARTREGRLQVELAQLNYMLPRLAGHGVEMSRLGGGIGTRGPGETQLETDRRRIAKRIKTVEVELEGVRTGRALHRRRRTAPFRWPRWPWPGTPTPANPRCSTGSRRPESWPTPACSPRSTPPCVR